MKLGVGIGFVTPKHGGVVSPPVTQSLTSKSGTDLTDKSGLNILTSRAA